MASVPTPRNAPCPCGSGKRFKDCHGAIGAPRNPPPAAAAELLERARAALAGGDSAAAEQAWRETLALDPGNAEACFHLGNALRARGEAAAAVEHYERGLRRAPGHAGLLNNLGQALEAIGQSDRAEACYRDALATEPGHAEALANLAGLLFARGRLVEALAVCDRLASTGRPLPPPMWVQRGIAQQYLGDLRSADASFAEAARLAPDDLAIQLNLGTVRFEQDRFADAESAWLRALELDPRNAYALSLLVYGRQQRCDWRGLADLFARIERVCGVDAGPGRGRHAAPFASLSMPVSPGVRLEIARGWASAFAPPQTAVRPRLARAAGERLRVGFVSSDLRRHAMLHLWMECWQRLDRARLETFAYSTRRPGPDEADPRVAGAFEHYLDVSASSVAEIASRIRDDRIAVLLDLNGYTRHAREGIFALRPAPVQVNCIGYPGTLGAPWYDRIYTDRFSLPEHLRGYCSERPLYMPHCAFPSDTTRLPGGAPPTRAECGLPDQAFVFCCFNNSFKILPEVFAIWMRLLQAVPGSVLWLLDTSSEAKANLRREASEAGVDAQRMIFAPRVSVGKFVARHAAADLFLDTYPYGAHTIANDALLAGLPVLSCVGESLSSRIPGSQLHAIGLPELVTEGFAEYEARALELATQPELLRRYRQRLAANRHTHPLFDMPRYARDFEQAMQQAWNDYVAGNAPA